MVLDWLVIGIQLGLNAVVLVGILSIFLLVFRKKGMDWLKMGFARWMKGLSEQAAEEGGASTPPTSGSFKLGGLPLGDILQLIQDPTIQKLIGKFMNRGSSGGGGW